MFSYSGNVTNCKCVLVVLKKVSLVNGTQNSCVFGVFDVLEVIGVRSDATSCTPSSSCDPVLSTHTHTCSCKILFSVQQNLDPTHFTVPHRHSDIFLLVLPERVTLRRMNYIKTCVKVLSK